MQAKTLCARGYKNKNQKINHYQTFLPRLSLGYDIILTTFHPSVL